MGPMTLLYLVRHGQTPWTVSGQHTSYTDLDLTPQGEEQARALRAKIDPSEFGLVLTSPRTRARRTAELAGFTAAGKAVGVLTLMLHHEWPALDVAAGRAKKTGD